MKPTISLRKALADKQLLGKVLSGESWRAWRILLIAAMGEALRHDERGIFTTLTGRPHEPGQRIEELAAVIGRRGGKSRALSILATYIAGLCEHRLAPGETGVLLLIAQASSHQSRIHQRKFRDVVNPQPTHPIAHRRHA